MLKPPKSPSLNSHRTSWRARFPRGLTMPSSRDTCGCNTYTVHYFCGLVKGAYLTKNNFIFFSEVLEHVFHVVNQMRPAFIRIELYPFVFDKAPQYFYTIQFWRIFWKIKDV